MTPLSVIIPELGHQSALEATLVSLLENASSSNQIIVVCSRDYQDPYALDDEIDFVRVSGPATWPELANYGLLSARHEMVQLILPGIRPTAAWTAGVASCFASSAVVAAVSPRLEANAQTVMGVTLSAGGIRQTVVANASTPAEEVIAPTLSAGFYRRSVLQAAGGWNCDIHPDLADIELGLRLQARGFACRYEPHSQMLDGESGSNSAPNKNVFQYTRDEERLYRFHLATRQQTALSLSHPLALASELVAAIPQGSFFPRLLGRCAGRFGNLPQPAEGQSPREPQRHSWAA